MNELSDEAKAARREYQRKWRAENGDKIRESNRRYWERKGAATPKPKQEPAQTGEVYRLNLKLDGELREYLSYEAWKNRISITALVNKILSEYRDAHDLSRLFQDFTEKEGDYL